MNFDDKVATVTFDPSRATVEAMVAALERAGYKGSFKAWNPPLP